MARPRPGMVSAKKPKKKRPGEVKRRVRWEPVRRQSSATPKAARVESGSDAEHGAFWHNLPPAPELADGKAAADGTEGGN